MADPDLIAMLHIGGVDVWNAWRKREPHVRPDLSGATICGTFFQVDLHRADLREATLRNAQLVEANLNGATLRGADLRKVNLSEALLSGADLRSADLRGATLSGAQITNADLSGAQLNDAHLELSNLVWTDFRDADLNGCRVYGVSAWALKLSDGTKQQNLIITEPGDPEITVDNIEVAQFVYLLLHNAKIRDVIDTIGKKAVLILGRFTPERKAVLDALRDELRKPGCNYVPIVFDFDKPGSRDLTATVSTLAHLSRFIIADLTDPSSIPYELATVVPTTPVPVQPILLADKREFAMFVDLQRRYHWVLPVHRYDTPAQLLADLRDRVIGPAEAKALELRGTTVAAPLNPRSVP